MKQVPPFLKLLLHIPLFRQPWVTWKTLTASWHIYLEPPVPLKEVAHSREVASIPSFGFFFLLICATVLATFGLLANSPAVIIGAMIVAPLMNPILSMAFAIATGNWKLYKRSLVTVFLGVVCAILVSYGISIFMTINVIGSEIVARIAPNLIDLGIAIAAGAAGSFSLTRQSIASSIAGVAIAVALIPPLCVVGIGIGIGDDIAAEFGQVIISNLSVSSGAFLLFLANLAGIIFASCFVFLSQSYGNLNKAFPTLMIWLLILVLLCGPLTNSLQEFLISNRINSEIYHLRKEHPEISRKTQVRYVGVRIDGNLAQITVLVNAPKETLTDEYLKSAEKRVLSSVSSLGVNGTDLVIRIIPVEIREYKSISR